MTTAQDPIAHAARLLRETAEELRQEYTLSSDRNNWRGDCVAKAAYDEHMAAAQALVDWEAAVGAGGVQALSAAPAVAAPAAPTPEHIAAMERAWLWMDNQADQQSKGGHATFDLMMLREERDALRAAIDAALKAVPGEPIKRGQWAWLPIEPTTGMLIAGNHGQSGDFSALKVWQDMIAALDRSADYTRPIDPPFVTIEPAGTPLGMYEHKCQNVTGHRGPSFVCQKTGQAVSQNSYCNNCHEAAPQQEAPKAAPGDAIDEAMRERDDAEDFIDALLDEVLGHERPEWSNLYGRADALNDVQERITALHKPAVDKAWGQFQSAKAAPQQEAQEPCPTCAALARTVMLDQVSFDRKPDCYGIRQITDDEGVEEWEDIRTSPDVAREEANDMMATGRGEIYEVVPLWTTPQPAPAPLSEPIDQLERALAIIGVVGAIDGHDVVRRESVLEIARRAALAAQGGE